LWQNKNRMGVLRLNRGDEMKRDWDLVRQILLALEKTESGRLMPGDVPGWDTRMVSYHFKIMNEAGLICAKCVAGDGLEDCVGLSQTWEGRELLDSIRAHSVWNQVKGLVRRKGLDLTYYVVKEAAKSILESLLQ
jgi:hypothetical protein